MFGILKKIFSARDNSTARDSIANGAVLIDVRSPGEFASGNIKGSINIPVDRLAGGTEGLKKDEPIIVYCRSGARSMAAKAMLVNKGFKNIVDGGSISNVSKLINAK